jgi:aryl-alcohol dehydrogenase-like predicted oxidoreductase
MRYRQLTGSNIEVSELCFGTMRYASKSGDLDEVGKAGRRALEEAIDRGVNFVHSSYEYGTRWLTGQTLEKHPRRRELHHIIKVNVPDWDEPQFSSEAFRDQVETALRELHADRIAVVQHLQRGVPRPEITSAASTAHRLAEFDRVAGALGEIASKMQGEGKIGTVMSFPYTVDYARRAVASEVYSGLVAYFNPLETEMYEFFDTLAEQNKDFISIRPLAGGILTDRRVDRDTLGADDRMKDPKWDERYRQIEAIAPAVGPLSTSWQRFAFRFSLGHPVIKSSVLGVNTVSHLDAAGPAPEVSVSVLERVAGINERMVSE